jgi:AraC family transcriptional regulator
MDRRVSTQRWMTLAARGGVFSGVRYGFTHRPETHVWAWRSLPDHILYFCMNGGFKVKFSDQTVRMVKESFLWIMPGVWHETQLLAANKPFRTYYLRFHLTNEDRVTSVRLRQDWVHREAAWHMMPLVRDLVQELQSPQEFHKERLHAKLVLLSAAALGGKIQQEPGLLTSPQRLRLYAYINAKVTSATPQDLANEAGLSIHYFRKIFHRTYGMSPKQWILRQRIMLGAIMMSETELTAKEIAYRLGYRDRYLFCRQFKQVMGVSARPFRRGTGTNPQLDHLKDDMMASPLIASALAATKRARRAAGRE